MLLNGDTNPTRDGTAAETPRCLLPECYAFVGNFNTQSKKSNLLKPHDISPSEAQEMLSQNLNACHSSVELMWGKKTLRLFACVRWLEKKRRDQNLWQNLHTAPCWPAHSVQWRDSPDPSRGSFSVGLLPLHTLFLRRFSSITPTLCHQSPHRRRLRAPTYYMGWAFTGSCQKMLSLTTDLLSTSWLIQKNDS